MNMHRKLKPAVLWIAVWATTAAPAFAGSPDTTQIETMTVTASKRTAEAQEVAIPMTVIDEVAMDDLGIADLKDAAARLPNFTYGGNRPDTVAFNYRGLGYNTFTEKQPVILNVDGVPWDSRFGVLLDFTDVAQVEFLRGPQGTLYGKNAMGGVLNITTRKPTGDMTGQVSATVEERNGYGVNFRVSGPVVPDKVLFSLGGAYFTTDGYMADHTPGGEEKWDNETQTSVFAKLSFHPSDRFDADFSYRFSATRAGNSPVYTGDIFTYDTHHLYKNPKMDRDTHDASLRMMYSATAFNLSAVTGYKHTSGLSKIFYQPSEYGCDMDVTEYAVSQEIKLTSKDDGDGPQWLFGVYADTGTLDDAISMEYDYAAYYMGVLVDSWPFEIDATSGALFGEVNLPVTRRGLSLTLGARYETVEKELSYRHLQTDYATGAMTGYNYIYMTENPTEYDIGDTWNALLGKIALQQQIGPKLLAYLSVSQGYMPGGFNYTNDIKENASFDEQKSLDYELGFKSVLLEKRLMLNMNLFYTRYEDLQILQNEAGTLIYYVNNAGKAHATGVEADFTAKVAGGLTLSGNVGIMDTEYDDYDVQTYAGDISYDGNTMTYAPDYTVNLTATYRHASGFFALADWRRLGETRFSEDNAARYRRKAFDLTDARIGWEFASGFEVYGYVRNLFDKEYITEAVAGAYDLFSVGEPRTFGVTTGYRF